MDLSPGLRGDLIQYLLATSKDRLSAQVQALGGNRLVELGPHKRYCCFEQDGGTSRSWTPCSPGPWMWPLPASLPDAWTSGGPARAMEEKQDDMKRRRELRQQQEVGTEGA